MRVADVSAHVLVKVDKGVSLREAAVELSGNEVGLISARDVLRMLAPDVTRFIQD
ncbi:MAG TPA: hypothetical protein VFD47_06775 [Actinomycetota bacterium]|nr:hypothetical protein [Actinomycetota bacterium]